jgi:hypothetical protein
MNKKVITILIILCLGLINVTIVSANLSVKNQIINQNQDYVFSEDYGIQWEMNFDSDWSYGARYEGPKPIGDCDNDGLNEMIVGGRDNKLRIFEWNEDKQTYLETHTLFPPFYPYQHNDAGGFTIGDLTSDGKNEIAATWGVSVHKLILGKYRTIGYNPWIFNQGGGSGDCYIGDYDNDGENELIVGGGPMDDWSDCPEITIFRWNGISLEKEAEWNNPYHGYTHIYMPGLADIDEDGKNEIVLGSSHRVFVLDWDSDNKIFEETIIKETGEDYYPFACVLKDSDMDGKNEIHVGYWSPMISIFEWNGTGYETKYEKEWPGEGTLIEGLDVGDVDEDSINEVCAGTDLIHILQWNGDTYIEEAVLPTFGHLAVVSVGDCDNDGKNELHAGSVIIDDDEEFMSWVFKHGLKNQIDEQHDGGKGRLNVDIKRAKIGTPLKNASVAAWNLESGTWYDIRPQFREYSTYNRYDLPEGEYLLRAHMEGYKSQEATINIYSGQVTTYTFTLKQTITRDCSSNNPTIHYLSKYFERFFFIHPILGRLLHNVLFNKIIT